MAASMVVTLEGNPFLDGVKDQARVIIDWISHTDGSVALGIKSTRNTAEAALGGTRLSLNRISGLLKSIQTIPGLNGDIATSLPTDQYDVTLLDQYSRDIVSGKLADRSGTVAEEVVFDPPVSIDTTEITVTIAGAGNGLKGRIIITLEEV